MATTEMAKLLVRDETGRQMAGAPATATSEASQTVQLPKQTASGNCREVTPMLGACVGFTSLVGALLGYDIGVISGAMVFIKEDMSLSNTQGSSARALRVLFVVCVVRVALRASPLQTATWNGRILTRTQTPAAN